MKAVRNAQKTKSGHDGFKEVLKKRLRGWPKKGREIQMQEKLKNVEDAKKKRMKSRTRKQKRATPTDMRERKKGKGAVLKKKGKKAPSGCRRWYRTKKKTRRSWKGGPSQKKRANPR